MRSGKTTSWYVGFLPSPNRGPFRLLAGSGRPTSHCFAFRPVSHDLWLLVEHSVMGLDVRELPDAAGAALIELCQTKGRLLLVPSTRRSIRWVPPQITCVSVVKDLVGLRAWWVITPRQLHCALLKKGAASL